MEHWKCVECGGGLVWNNDFDFEDYGAEGEGIVRVFTCPNCGAYIEAYLSDEDNKKRAGD